MSVLKNVKENVRKILQEFPETRDSDKLLQIKYLNLYSKISFSSEQVQALLKAPSLETIRRSRQAIQATGQYTASKETQKQRKTLEHEYISEFRKPRYEIVNGLARII